MHEGPSARQMMVAARRRAPSGHSILGPCVAPGHVRQVKNQSSQEEVSHCWANWALRLLFKRSRSDINIRDQGVEQGEVARWARICARANQMPASFDNQSTAYICASNPAQPGTNETKCTSCFYGCIISRMETMSWRKAEIHPERELSKREFA